MKLTSEAEAARYTRRSILRSERMYGEGYQSPGGDEAVHDCCQHLSMRPGMRVLDIGSGLGGAAFYLARRYEASVLGLDTAPAMVELSNERRRQHQLDNVAFRLGDIRNQNLEPSSFDLIWTRDCLLYVAQKAPIWRSAFQALRSGGQLFITDFCRSPRALQPETAAYVEECHYHLLDLPGYSAQLRGAGFDVRLEQDRSAAFRAGMVAELKRLERSRAEFLREFGLEDYHHLVERWQRKIHLCDLGDLRWGWFVAVKP